MKITKIHFDTLNVKAILAGNKTMTRRLMKPAPDPHPESEAPFIIPRILGDDDRWGHWAWDTAEGERIVKACPYGEPGDILWVRETFQKVLRINSKSYEKVDP